MESPVQKTMGLAGVDNFASLADRRRSKYGPVMEASLSSPFEFWEGFRSGRATGRNTHQAIRQQDQFLHLDTLARACHGLKDTGIRCIEFEGKKKTRQTFLPSTFAFLLLGIGSVSVLLGADFLF